ncbi:glycosyltransferase family 2 protein [Rhodococcus pseudokoreensis]|uniref:Glycosyltransferase family 2 protein n=1 Tax=Rhodococcus pseudokoreensis TaxID=2811421 RepID=A0A974ZTJ7_9NOCA|nr:glycosyltransferase family 2 protein [Rhodococcus pseudokoreensis]QSE89739.1 glycosyltransferase family 2 protein [Rhodococcus pseudokoreensis]
MAPIRVSAVIPTVGRPTIADAVMSALAQATPELLMEVVVSVDGTDSVASEIRKSLPSCVKVICSNRKSNGNSARNRGIQAATGSIIALLDDDDLWVKDKIRKQLAASPTDHDSWVTTSAVETFGNSVRELWPVRPPNKDEDIADYMMVREHIRSLPKWLQSSTWLGPREVFLRNPFDETLNIHQDIDWIVRNRNNVEIFYVPEALTLYRTGAGATMSSQSRITDSLKWVLQSDLELSARARHDFALCVSTVFSSRKGEVAKTIRAIRVLRQHGSPSICALTVYSFRILTALLNKMRQK